MDRSRSEGETRSGQDTDGDGIDDDEDILDDGNAVIILSIDYLDMDYDSDFWSDGDPQAVFWIDGDNDGQHDEEDGELWWAPLFNDTDVISDEGFDDEGVLWHGFDIPDDMDLVFIEIWLFDDDNDGDYEINDISSDGEAKTINGSYIIEEDGPTKEAYQDNGEDDGDDGLDAYVEFSIHIIKGTTINKVTPSNYIQTMYEGQSITFSADEVMIPSYISGSIPMYVWRYSFQNDLEEYLAHLPLWQAPCLSPCPRS